MSVRRQDAAPAQQLTEAGASRGIDFPCTLFQEGVLRHSSLLGPAQNATYRFQLNGRIDADIVGKALQALVDRHEILRTSFPMVDGTFVQRVVASAMLPFCFVDISGLPSDAAGRYADALGEKEVSTPFDIGTAPLFRAALVRTAQDEALLALTFHNAVIDGWSLGILTQEFVDAARALHEGRSFSPEPVDLHHGDYALWQQQVLESDALDGDRHYWHEHLTSLTSFRIPYDRPKRKAGLAKSEIVSTVASRATTDRLEQFAKEQGHTFFQVAVATLALCLRRLNPKNEVVFSSPVAARDSVEAEGIVGPLLNTIILRFDMPPDQTVASAIGRIAAVVDEALSHRDLPVEDVIPPSPDTPYPVCPINFTLLRALGDFAFGAKFAAGAFTMTTVPSQACGAVWDLNFFMVDRASGWRLSCEGNADLYDQDTLERIVDLWRDVIESLVEFSTKSIGDLATESRTNTERPVEEAALQVRAPRRAAAAATKHLRVLELSDQGHATPIIMINIGGTLRRVSDRLPDRPFIDLSFSGPYDPPNAAPDVAHYVDDAVAMIERSAPSGPYIIAGECFTGGTVALETARRLQERGHVIELLVIFDAWAPGYRETMPKVLQHWRLWKLRYLRWKLEGGILRNLVLLVKGRGSRDVGDPMQSTDDPQTQFYRNVMIEACAKLRPLPYQGNAVVFRTAEAATGIGFRHDMGWRSIVQGQLSVQMLPTDHYNMYNDASSYTIANTLKAILQSQPKAGEIVTRK
jgi:thioesterase domain-containing protein